MQYRGNQYKVVCVLPAYNAEKTLENTIKDIDRESEGINDTAICFEYVIYLNG